MGDHFTMLADTDVALPDATALRDNVVAQLQDAGIITRKINTSEFAIGEGFAPGPRIPEIYQPADDMRGFSGNSVEPKVERHSTTGHTDPRVVV